MAARLDGRGAENRIFLAAPLELSTLEREFAPQLQWQRHTRWDSRSESVVAREERRLGALVLAERPLEQVDSDALTQAMVQGVREMGPGCLPWDAASRQLQARIASLRHWLPEEAWPDLSEQALWEQLDDWLSPWLGGITRRAQLERLDMTAILLNFLDWPQRQRLDELAPTHLQVPSGSRKRLEYSIDGAAPVLAVKLQELFGLSDTPTVAGGRVAVMLHLLSPAQRPLQVTQDLKSFWDNTYTEVKKEMKGRYPKHPWPDDPWNALPTAATRRKNR